MQVEEISKQKEIASGKENEAEIEANLVREETNQIE